MRLVKGAVAALLDESAGRQDEAAVVAFRGTSATLVLAPTRECKQAQAALSYLPTGGRTPLAHGLELAAQYVNERTVLVLLTDGRANVPSRGEDPWADALRAAAAIRCAALVVDSERGPGATGRARELARAMRASHLTIDGLDEVAVLRLARGEEPEPA
jgi:magnesium chelatase subunit D